MTVSCKLLAGQRKIPPGVFKYGGWVIPYFDEFWLKIFPVTLGQGKRLFDEGTMPSAFQLTKSMLTPAGVIVANYERSGEVKTGSIL